MFQNLREEMDSKGIDVRGLAIELGISTNTLYLKLKGDSEFTFGEVKKIKKILGVDTPIEVLFAEVSQCA